MLEVVEIEATRSVASVSAVYQFLSLGQKSKVIFVPGSCLFFILSQNFLDIFFNSPIVKLS
ncbi:MULTISPECIES: hypothetical protein [unclassified Enterococcus]|uniref:hypothetical protein n=1 Tax=unclassified Enterococcus TaxID=2608891 RepID=UPI0031F5FA92